MVAKAMHLYNNMPLNRIFIVAIQGLVSLLLMKTGSPIKCIALATGKLTHSRDPEEETCHLLPIVSGHETP